MRKIYIPSLEKYVTMRQYINAVKLAKNNPDKTFQTGLTCWWPCTGQDIVNQFVDGLMERINDCIPYIDRK